MVSRTRILLALTVLLGFGASPILLSSQAFAADTWYVGQGANPNMYVTYQIQQFETNNGRPFQMTIYFQNQDSNGYWHAPAFVVDQGRVLKGTLLLGSNLAPLNGNQTAVPSEMQPYVNAYTLSLPWIQGNSPQSQPKSLSAITWGGLGGIGVSPLNRAGTRTLTVNGTSYDTTEFLSHKGQSDSTFFINQNFPYPIQATLFADTTNGGVPETQFKFNLLGTGTGPPQPPNQALQPPTPLTADTPSGNYKITINWEPQTIEAGKNITYSVTFADSRGTPLQQVSYNLAAIDGNGNITQELKNQITDQSGVGKNTLTFSNSGPAKVRVTINSVANLDTGIIIEKADFDMVVVPEFPLNVVFVLALVVTIVVVLGRFTGLQGLPGRGRGAA
jgi:hypothetical protein